MFRHSISQASFGIRRPWLTKVAGVNGIAILAIVAGIGYSQETKTSDAKKPDLSKRGAIGVFLYESEDHVLVSKVVPKSPAEKAGLQVGDDIRYVNNELTKTAQGLMDEIGSFTPGTKMDVVVRRGGKRLNVKIDVISHAELFPNVAPPKPVATTPLSPDAVTPEQARKIRALELQLARVQEQLQRVKSETFVAKPAPPSTGFDINGWLEQHRSGENGGDPSLFQ